MWIFSHVRVASGPRVASTFVKREAAISSLEKGGQWMLALELLAHAEAEGFSGFDMIRPGKESTHRFCSAKYAVYGFTWCREIPEKCYAKLSLVWRLTIFDLYDDLWLMGEHGRTIMPWWSILIDSSYCIANHHRHLWCFSLIAHLRRTSGVATLPFSWDA